MLKVEAEGFVSRVSFGATDGIITSCENDIFSDATIFVKNSPKSMLQIDAEILPSPKPRETQAFTCSELLIVRFGMLKAMVCGKFESGETL